MVVVTMHDISELLQVRIITHHMEYKPVQDIFCKGPAKHPHDIPNEDLLSRESKRFIRINRKSDKYRHVHGPYYQRMRFGEHFQVIVLKQSSLSLIMNFIKFHICPILLFKFKNFQSTSAAGRVSQYI